MRWSKSYREIGIRFINDVLISVCGLKQNGVFILEAYHPNQLKFKTGGPPTVELLMTIDKLKIELAGLKFKISQEIEREIHEGQGHSGLSAVVQILAHK